MDVGTPYPDSPASGVLRTDAEFLPLAHPEFTTGPPGEDATEVARVIDRGLRESETIDVEKLCIEEGEKVWTVFVDFYPINHDGNLIDSGSLAAIIALENTKKPSIDKDGNVDRENLKDKLILNHQPLTITIGKVGDKLLIDPTFEEEKVLDSFVSIAVTEEEKIVSMQKMGLGVLTDDDLSKMIDLAVKKTKELRKLIKDGKKDTKPKTKANKSRKSKASS